VNDDQPSEIRPAAGPLVSVPYTLELNDIPMMVIQHHTSDAWAQRARSTGSTRKGSLAASWPSASVPTPRWCRTGSSFEAVYDYMRKHKVVWLTTGEEIYEWYRQGRRSS